MLRLARVAAVGRYPDLKSVTLAPSERAERGRGFDEWPNASDWYRVRPALDEDFGKAGVSFEIKSESPYWQIGWCD